MPFNIESGAFVPTTNVWDDISALEQVDISSPQFKELLVRLYQNVNNIAILLNLKDTGYYPQTEFVNGQLYFPQPTLNSSTQVAPIFRQVFRLVINFGALPNSTTKSVAHNIAINNAYTFTRIYGCASDTVSFHYIPLPYSSATLANNIELSVDATNVTVKTAANFSAYTITYIVIEYLKQ